MACYASKEGLATFRYHCNHIDAPCCVVVAYTTALHGGFLLASECLLTLKSGFVHHVLVLQPGLAIGGYFNFILRQEAAKVGEVLTTGVCVLLFFSNDSRLTSFVR